MNDHDDNHDDLPATPTYTEKPRFEVGDVDPHPSLEDPFCCQPTHDKTTGTSYACTQRADHVDEGDPRHASGDGNHIVYTWNEGEAVPLPRAESILGLDAVQEKPVEENDHDDEPGEPQSDPGPEPGEGSGDEVPGADEDAGDPGEGEHPGGG